MPQLSPLSWILLSFLFWSSFFCTFVMLWWHKKSFYLIQKHNISNK